jgi:Zn-dependent membrane protease YugP
MKLFYGWNPTYWIFVLPALLLGLFAQARVRNAYQKYLRVPIAAGVTGEDAARRMMQTSGTVVDIEGTPGELSDHYDPRRKVLRLSRGVATRASVASVAIAAHELGHAQQDLDNYLPMRVRAGLVPAVTVASWVGPLLFFAGLMLNLANLAWLGVLAFGAATLFALVTVPVEINASRRGLRMLEESGILMGKAEHQGARQVLGAAAWTYVAALVQSLSTLLYYLSILGGRGRSRR